MEPIERTIAERVKEAGGRTFYVGGFVRDKLLGRETKDVDIEVHGIAPETLYAILETVGEPVTFGANFGIYSLRKYGLDIAMPRKEHATGRGHRDFEVFVDPFIGTTEAARRRDFTMNALMEDVLTGEVLDPFGGRDDIANRTIRHIDDKTFVEDPLRVLRAAQFAARFGFRVADETTRLCRTVDLSPLSRERVEEELKKALLQAPKPSVFFEVLREMDRLDVWFPDLKALIGLAQDPIFHPEGDVWIHTMEVLDRAAAFRDDVSDPYAFLLLALTHDLGKIDTSEETGGRIHAYRHETEGLPRVEAFLRRLTNEKDVLRYVTNMVPLHMRPNMLAYSKSALKKTNALFDEAVAPEDLINFAAADRPVVAGTDPFSGDDAFLRERYAAYEELMARPYVKGQDLIDAGLTPDESFSDVLAFAHKLRLAGIGKDNALKQTLAYAKKKVNTARKL
ncbi:MAG: tRNA nucleotidyltransferase [Firmicutes bacterium]|nr:tRNA nucleotidyltransferase [Bacillota bacterium]